MIFAPHAERHGFTLVELLVTIAIIGMMASLVLVALFSAQEDAKIARTETQIAKIHELIMTKWEEYETRPVPVDVTTMSAPYNTYPVPLRRLLALRELQRVEMPDRKSDVIDPTLILSSSGGTLRRSYLRSAQAYATGGNINNWTEQNQGSECLFLIISKMRDNGRSAIEFFGEDEIGDTDGDGVPEILDAWGRPIEFLRWAPGFVGLPFSSIQPGVASITVPTVLIGDLNPDADGNTEGAARGISSAPADPFDLVRADPRWRDFDPNNAKQCLKENDPFALYPLIVSAGPDEVFDIFFDDTGAQPFQYSRTATPPYAQYNYNGWENSPGLAFPNDPYTPLPSASADPSSDGPVFMGRPSKRTERYVDNISNHTLNVN